MYIVFLFGVRKKKWQWLLSDSIWFCLVVQQNEEQFYRKKRTILGSSLTSPFGNNIAYWDTEGWKAFYSEQVSILVIKSDWLYSVLPNIDEMILTRKPIHAFPWPVICGIPRKYSSMVLRIQVNIDRTDLTQRLTRCALMYWSPAITYWAISS